MNISIMINNKTINIEMVGGEMLFSIGGKDVGSGGLCEVVGDLVRFKYMLLVLNSELSIYDGK